MNSKSHSAEDVYQRYQRAQFFLQEIWTTKSTLLNTSLYPIWIGNSDCFWYERELPDGEKEYRLVEAEAASNTLAFDHKKLALALEKEAGSAVDPKRLPLSQVELTLQQDASSASRVDKVKFCAFGGAWLYECDKGSCEKVESLSDDESVSPDGKYVLYKKDFNLWVREVETGEEYAVTSGGAEDYAYGAASFVWGVEYERKPQAIWSPDSKRVLTIQRDIRNVRELPIVHHIPKDGSLRPSVEFTKMAHPGDDYVETLRLLSIDIETANVTSANYRQIPTVRSGYGYFADGMGWWSNDNQFAYFVDMERGDKSVRVVEFDTSTGATKILFEETSETQINLSLNLDERPTFIPLPASDELLWFSERSGYAHLYLYDTKNGLLKKSVTQGDWLVRQIIAVDEGRREAFIQTAGRDNTRDPYYCDICRVNLDTGELVPIRSSDHELQVITQKHMNTIEALLLINRDVSASNGVSATGNFVVVTQSRADEVPIHVVLNRDGDIVLELETADLSALPDNWHWPEPVKLLAEDGKTDTYGLVFKPSDFDPEQRYPVISHVYNSPELPYVAKGSFTNGVFYGQSYFDAAAVAELGFIVIQLDGRGTPFRSKAFHDENYGWIESSSKLVDHVAGVTQLAKSRPYMDLNRTGIFSPNGGPGGLQGLLQHPDFYKVGVANMLHDSRLSSASVWGDKHESVSGPTADHHYPENMAENLEGKLLIMHGMLDAGTPPAAVFRVIEAFKNANKDFDMLLLPNLGHEAPVGYVVRRAWDYFVRNLLMVEPPKNFELRSAFDNIDLDNLL